MSNHASSPKQPRLSDQLWTKIRAQDMSKETFKAYWSWIRQFILFHDKHHPREMGEAEIEKFLSSLAVDRNLSVSSQDQAFHALHVCRGLINNAMSGYLCGQSVPYGYDRMLVGENGTHKQRVRNGEKFAKPRSCEAGTSSW